MMGIFLMVASYRLDRIKIWLHPEKYEKGYQTLQALYAIGSGGLFGKGLGQSIQKMGFIPESHNDYIFSVICEELGLFGAVCVILLFALLLWRCVMIAMSAPDLYGALLVVGVITHIAVQVIVNSTNRCSVALYQLWRNGYFGFACRDWSGVICSKADRIAKRILICSIIFFSPAYSKLYGENGCELLESN